MGCACLQPSHASLEPTALHAALPALVAHLTLSNRKVVTARHETGAPDARLQ